MTKTCFRCIIPNMFGTGKKLVLLQPPLAMLPPGTSNSQVAHKEKGSCCYTTLSTELLEEILSRAHWLHAPVDAWYGGVTRMLSGKAFESHDGMPQPCTLARPRSCSDTKIPCTATHRLPVLHGRAFQNPRTICRSFQASAGRWFFHNRP